jgi:hypothetical protein
VGRPINPSCPSTKPAASIGIPGQRPDIKMRKEIDAEMNFKVGQQQGKCLRAAVISEVNFIQE